MVNRVQAYKSSTGAMFETMEEADKDEIRDAAEVLDAVEKSHLINLATGHSTCKRSREAILRLAQALKELPTPAEPVPSHL